MIAMDLTALHTQLGVRLQLTHAAAPEGDVDNLLVDRQNFTRQRVHIHILCERFSKGK